MFRSPGLPDVARRQVWSAAGVVVLVGALSAIPLHAQQPPAPAPAAPAAAAQAAPTTRVFAGDAGMVLNFIKADKVADFEMVVTKLKEALAKSAKPERKQQAASWKVFKAAEPGAGGSVLYVFIVDPSVKGADYSVANILAEALPADQVNEIYKAYAGAYATGQNIVNLSIVSDLGK
jgi:hypothetical protein